MNNKYLNIYNNLIKLTRNKFLYLNLSNNETFSDRIIFLLLQRKDSNSEKNNDA